MTRYYLKIPVLQCDDCELVLEGSPGETLTELRLHASGWTVIHRRDICDECSLENA